MALATITGKERNTAGAVVAGVQISLQLLPSDTTTFDSTSEILNPPQTTTSAADGTWSIAAERTDTMTPPPTQVGPPQVGGMVYQLSRYDPASGLTKVDTIYNPAGGGVWSTLLTTAPSLPTPTTFPAANLTGVVPAINLPALQMGPYASRPAPTLGSRYFATDDPVAGTGSQYVSFDGSTWTLVGGAKSELAFASITSNYVGTGAGFGVYEDLPGVTVTFTLTTPRVVEISAFLSSYSANANTYIEAAIADGSNVLHQIGYATLQSTASNSVWSHYLTCRLSLSAGVQTFKVRFTEAGAASSTTIQADALHPAFIQAIAL